METNSKYRNERYENIKKYIPFFLLLLLTVLLMIFFRHNKQNITKFIEKGKRNLLSIYTDNLRPLFADTQFSEEELFNFALYRTLPIDKEKNKVLILSTDKGSPVYEISSVPVKRGTKNYDTFIKYMGMNDQQREQVDSILNAYTKPLYTSILTSDKNIYAVNPSIVKIQQALLADLVTYAQKVNLEKTQRLFPAQFQFGDSGIASLINAAKEKPSADYLLITPDTVAQTGLSFNQKKFDQQMMAFEEGKKYSSEIAKMKEFKWEFEPKIDKDVDLDVPPPVVDFKIDPHMSKIKLSGEALTKMIDDSLRIKLEEVAQKIKKISIPASAIREHRTSKTAPHVGFIPPVPDVVEIMKAIKVGEITSHALKYVSDLNIAKLIEESMKYDSSYKQMMKDSVQSRKFKEKVRELNRKLKRMNIDVDSAKH